MSDLIPFEKIIERVKGDVDYIALEAYKKGYAMGKYIHEPRWIPITERLPEIPKGIKEYFNFEKEKDVAAEEYIVMIKGAKKPTTLYWTDDGEWWDLDNRNQHDVTAWMPLPDPYEEEQ